MTQQNIQLLLTLLAKRPSTEIFSRIS